MFIVVSSVVGGAPRTDAAGGNGREREGTPLRVDHFRIITSIILVLVPR
jgi:hypothetical protein